MNEIHMFTVHGVEVHISRNEDVLKGKMTAINRLAHFDRNPSWMLLGRNQKIAVFHQKSENSTRHLFSFFRFL